LAVVGVAGPAAVALVARCFTPRGGRPLAERPDGAIVFGRWGDPARGEELVVVRQAADRLEVHCHGGLAASAAVLASLEEIGALRQPWPDWLREGGAGVIELEAREALARAGGPKAARILCRQLAGVLEAEFVRIASLRATDDPADAAEAAALGERLLRASRVGLRLVRPWRVVVSGPVNAGKSSLVNAVAGYSRSIVSAEPGTTRDVVETRLVLDGWEVDLIDTAGLRDPAEATSATERAGIERALAAAAGADLVLRVGQLSKLSAEGTPLPQLSVEGTQLSQLSAGGSGGRTAFQAVCPEAGQLSKLSSDGPPTLHVFSKCDLTAGVVSPPGTIRTSAVTGEGIDALAVAIVRSLVPEETADPSLLVGAVPFTERQVALLRS
jgi:tRNA modification GTPase